MEYDQEFEKLWNSKYAGPATKDIAYEFWNTARASKHEQKTIELQGGGWSITGDGFSYFSNTESYKNAGRERKTEVDAKKAAQFMRKRDRLTAFVYEHCGFEGEYKRKECDFYIYSNMNGDYFYVQEDEFPDLCKQYMSEATAKWLCEKLNSGEIVL